MAYCSLSSYPISSLRACTWPIRGLDWMTTHRYPIQIIYNQWVLLWAQSPPASWPASWPSLNNILPFILGCYQDQVEGNPPGSFQGPPCQSRGWRWGGPSQWGGGWQPSSPDLQGSPVWMVMDPQRLWQVTPITEEWRQELTVSVRYFYLFKHFHSTF